MCSHAYENKEERALSQFIPPLPLRMGISCWWGRAEGVGKGAETGAQIRNGGT